MVNQLDYCLIDPIYFLLLRNEGIIDKNPLNLPRIKYGAGSLPKGESPTGKSKGITV
jgi:hypothetical protein